jgi:hypothetical protein
VSHRIPKATYEKALLKLQAELVTLQEWTKVEGKRIVVVFEGRDAAGKGSTIKRFTQYLNPRLAQIVALPTPTEREKGQWYFQKYVVICQRGVKSDFLTVPGTTAPVSKKSWVTARRMSTDSFYIKLQYLSEC